MIDLICHNHGEQYPKISCLSEGFVRLVDCMPRISYDKDITTLDHAVTQAARLSYSHGTKTINKDKALLRYLLRHMHTSPFEMIEFKFHMKLPIFIARQIVRHRTASLNELSGRYSILPCKFDVPSKVREQSKSNKQGSEGLVNEKDSEWFVDTLEELCENAYQKYHEALAKGISREQAREFLPINVYTEWFWKVDLHNLLHFLSLRCDEHAQKEVRDYANAILELITPLVPVTIEAWNDYDPLRGGMLLTKQEVEFIKDSNINEFSESKLKTGNKREKLEWKEKAEKLGLCFTTVES